MATALSGSSIESDYFASEMGKPSHKARLTDFTLEGVLHTKQCVQLDSLQLE